MLQCSNGLRYFIVNGMTDILFACQLDYILYTHFLERVKQKIQLTCQHDGDVNFTVTNVLIIRLIYRHVLLLPEKRPAKRLDCQKTNCLLHQQQTDFL